MSATQKKKKVKAVQQKRKLFRANEPLLSVFMWGVNHTIHELTHVNVPVMLLPDDFKAYTKAKVDNYLFNKENMPSWFKVKEYCPLVFRNLRERFGITDEDYLNSLTKSEPLHSESPGKSGARFLMSHDKKYVIKTMVSEEVEEIHHILKEYHQYVVERHADTLLPQYLGMYRFIVADQMTYMMVMRNVFSPYRKMHRKYDLKGSTVDRSASDKERSKDLPTLKDNDFTSDGVSIDIGPDAKRRFVEVLAADVEWLSSLKLMDYSLLVGIHDINQALGEAEGGDGAGDLCNAAAADDESGGEDEHQSPSTEDSTTIVTPTPPNSPLVASLEEQLTLEQHRPRNPAPKHRVTDVLDPDDDRFAIKSDLGISGHHEIYYMALIDILTHYGMKKRTASVAKQVKHGADAEISTVHPEQYAKRFLDFVNKVLQ